MSITNNAANLTADLMPENAFVNNELRQFNTWKNGMGDFIKSEIGVSVYTGKGIYVNMKENIIVLRSEDGTPYYKDNLDDEKSPIYTCEGKIGDQDVQYKANKHLLSGKYNIYLYRVSRQGKNKVWTWYGKYKVNYFFEIEHVGEDTNKRKIIQVNLIR